MLIKCEVQIHSMYKNVPDWTQLLNLLYELNYMVIDWKTIGLHATRSPVEADMVFIPDFKKREWEKVNFRKTERIYKPYVNFWSNKNFTKNFRKYKFRKFRIF